MTQEARIGTRVIVGESEWRGFVGTICGRWGNPEHPAFDVLLDDGRMQLFWSYELEEIQIGGEQRLPGPGRQKGRLSRGWLRSSRGFPEADEEKEKNLQPGQTVSEMANEVLTRQAKAQADRNGEPIEDAMEAVLNTEAGTRLRELRDGSYGEEGVKESQVETARERAEERSEDLGKRLGEAPEFPTHG